MLKLINSACDICDNDIAHFPLPVTKIARKTTLCALLAWNYIFKPSRRVPWNLFLFVRMNIFVYYHSALLAHFPLEDTKIAEELRGAPRESPHNRDFEETVNLIVREVHDHDRNITGKDTNPFSEGRETQLYYGRGKTGVPGEKTAARAQMMQILNPGFRIARPGGTATTPTNLT